MTGVELLHERSLSPYYFFIVVIVIRYETTAAARWALLFIVRTFFNYAFAVALWASFHTRLALTVIFSTRAGNKAFPSLCLALSLRPALPCGAEGLLCSF